MACAAAHGKGPVLGALSDTAVKAAASVSEAVLSPTRSNRRLAGVSDEHTLLKAEQRAVARNLEEMGGKVSTDSFCSIPLSSAVDSVKGVVVNLLICP